MTTGIMIAIIIVLIIIVIMIISIKNRLVKEEQNIFAEYNNAKVVVDRRFKNLESTVNLMKSHNEAISKAYEKVIEKRNKANAKGPNPDDAQAYAEIEQDMKNIVKEVNLTVERYPELGQMFDANKFQTVMTQHDRDVEMSKKLYNKEVEEFNILIKTIPYNFFASGKKEHPYWEVANSQEKDDFIPQF